MSELKIRETAPFYVLPTQRYDLTTKPPSESMQEDFTFFMSFKVDIIIKTQNNMGAMFWPEKQKLCKKIKIKNSKKIEKI